MMYVNCNEYSLTDFCENIFANYLHDCFLTSANLDNEEEMFWYFSRPFLLFTQGVFSLNNFRENLTSRKLYLRLRNFLAEQRALELRDLYKEVGLWNPNHMGNVYNYSLGVKHF